MTHIETCPQCSSTYQVTEKSDAPSDGKVNCVVCGLELDRWFGGNGRVWELNKRTTWPDLNAPNET